jgi:hypothetical protein
MLRLKKWFGFAGALGLAWGLTTAPASATPTYAPTEEKK